MSGSDDTERSISKDFIEKTGGAQFEEGNEESESESFRIDSLSRYERILDVQINLLGDVDSKAEHLTRFAGLLIGVLLTGLSVIGKLDNVGLSIFSTEAQVFFIIGIGSLLISLFFAIFTYLNSSFMYGPSAKTGRYIANTDVDEDEYTSLILGAYADAIEKNHPVLEENFRRFRNALLGLVESLVFFSGTIVLIVANGNQNIEYAAIIVIVCVALIVYLKFPAKTT